MLTNEGYFARYGENLSRTSTTYEAWYETEREFSRTYSSGGTIIRRFLNYNAFREALRLHKQGVRPSYAKIGFLYLD